MVINTLSYDDALRAVKAQVAASRTSFHAGMFFLPKARREAMYALYGFCRAVDDIADDSPTPAIAAQGLEQWREKIAHVFRGRAEDAITTVLLPAIARFSLVEKDFQDIIDGMAMDSTAPSSQASATLAPDMQTLDCYCDRVASAVGRASVRIFGDDSPRAMMVAHHLGRALQLTNILRDVAEDAARGRLYLPRHLLEKHDIASRVPDAVLRDRNLPALCRDVAAMARFHYDHADQAMAQCVRAAMRPAKIMRLYYGAIFDALVATAWRDPRQRITLTAGQKLYLCLKGLLS